MLRNSTCSYKELNGHLLRPDRRDNQSQPASSSNYIPLSADRTFLGTTDDYTGPHSPWPSTVSLESAAPSKWSSSPSTLRASQVSIGHTSLTIVLEKSKTSQFSSPAPIQLPTPRRAQFLLCVRHRSAPSTSPLFLFPDGSRLTAKLVTTMLKRRTQTSIQAFIAATAESGLPDHLIQKLGRWSYIRPSTDLLHSSSATMARHRSRVSWRPFPGVGDRMLCRLAVVSRRPLATSRYVYQLYSRVTPYPGVPSQALAIVCPCPGAWVSAIVLVFPLPWRSFPGVLVYSSGRSSGRSSQAFPQVGRYTLPWRAFQACQVVVSGGCIRIGVIIWAHVRFNLGVYIPLSQARGFTVHHRPCMVGINPLIG